MDSWAYNATILESYRIVAIPNAVFLWLNYLPAVFIAYVCYKKEWIFEKFRAPVVFYAGATAISTLPETITMTLFAIFVHDDIPTSTFICTFFRMGYVYMTRISHLATTVLGFNRIFDVIFEDEFDFTFCCLFLGIMALPTSLFFILDLLYGEAMHDTICSPVLISPDWEIRAQVYQSVYAVYYIVGPICLGYCFLFNVYFYVQGRHWKPPGQAEDELWKAAAFMVIGLFQFFTFGLNSVLLAFYLPERVMDAEIQNILETLGKFGPGVSLCLLIAGIYPFNTLAWATYKRWPWPTDKTMKTFRDSLCPKSINLPAANIKNMFEEMFEDEEQRHPDHPSPDIELPMPFLPLP